MRRGIAALGCVLVTMGSVPGCARPGSGTPVADTSGTQSGAAQPTSIHPSRTTTATTGTSPAGAHPDFGVVPTSEPIRTGAVTCQPSQRPPVGVTAQVADPGAPLLTIAVPDGWTMQGGTGDIGARMAGPEQMSATVTIVATALSPQAAFADYADRLTSGFSVSSLSVLPAELCDYSGQKMTGVFSGGAGAATEFADRVAHIPTGSGTYLVSVHTEAPVGNPAFDAASAELTGQIEVTIP
ncbi:hypothetical protein [Mycolicibacterium neoaurum]|uniref:Lipoprotein LpqN n=1 Tax=Mycolicibacterium neoaurum TaxID=1795 RepID=A0AAV2WRM5_MYCNE|nr:hypothetical protein [Mycolicibacterium neoaurum]TLH58978.1 hypothetical protein C1S81_12885 [Mycolicibacterium neoaurum]CDQ46852.1 putative lipoprotein LpqN [Mycolicibacterium neoaurum]